MGTLTSLIRMAVIIVNVLFMIAGLVFFAGGLFLRFGDSVIDKAVSGVETALESSISSAGFGTVDVDVDWSSVLFELALAFTFMGLAIIIITMMGCCGSCYMVKCMLIFYIVVCTILLIGQAVTVGIIYGSPKTIKDPLKTSLKKKIQSDYTGLSGTNLVSQGFNVIMQEVECCGVDSYADFTGSTNWVIDYTSNTPPVTLKTPLSCCKTLPSSDDYTCAGSTASSSNNYLDTGCFDKIWDKIFGNITIAATVFGALGALQLLLIIFAFLILCSERNSKQNKIRPVKPAPKQKRNTHVRRRNNPVLMSRKH